MAVRLQNAHTSHTTKSEPYIAKSIHTILLHLYDENKKKMFCWNEAAAMCVLLQAQRHSVQKIVEKTTEMNQKKKLK